MRQFRKVKATRLVSSRLELYVPGTYVHVREPPLYPGFLFSQRREGRHRDEQRGQERTGNSTISQWDTVEKCTSAEVRSTISGFLVHATESPHGAEVRSRVVHSGCVDSKNNNATEIMPVPSNK